MRPRTLKVVPPPPTDAEMWKKLLNFLYLHKQDALFKWAKGVQAAVHDAEREKSSGRREGTA